MTVIAVVTDVKDGVRKLRTAAKKYDELSPDDQKQVRHMLYQQLGHFVKDRGIPMKTMLPQLQALNEEFGHPESEHYVRDSRELPDVLSRLDDGHVVYVTNMADATMAQDYVTRKGLNVAVELDEAVEDKTPVMADEE